MKNCYSKYFWTILLVGVLVSCHSEYTQNTTILQAEKQLNTSPDSAYLLLTSIAEPNHLPKADYAAWCLNFTNAQYKLQKEIKSDSLIMISVNYYKNQNLPKQSGRAYYLLGYVMELLNENKKAMEAYKEAEYRLKPTDENKLKGLVRFNMGYMCMQDEMYQQSLSYFKQSLHYFKQCKEYKYQAYNYREMSNMMHRLNAPLDSVMLFSNMALKIALQAGDSANYYSILSRQGEILYNKDYKRSKVLLLKGYRYFPSMQSHYGLFLAYVYAKLNQSDSAKYYLQQSMVHKKNSPDKVLEYHAAALIAKHRNENDKAYYYMEKSYLIRDSLYQVNIQSQLYKIDKQYDSTQKEIENVELNLENRTKVVWIALLVVVILVVLIILLLISIRNKNKHEKLAVEKQNLVFEVERNQIRNIQKRELLLLKLNSKINNTLQFNKLGQGLLQHQKQEIFIQEITRQSIIEENEWNIYIAEVNNVFENRLISMKENFGELTLTDLMVIALICLKVKINDACNLLQMTKNTMYARRKRIKKRLGLEMEVDLDDWLLNYVMAVNE
ncbi:MAG: hypothetical protein WCJ61_11365 [Paludibacter sp.]